MSKSNLHKMHILAFGLGSFFVIGFKQNFEIFCGYILHMTRVQDGFIKLELPKCLLRNFKSYVLAIFYLL